jgi:hypothetical protein
MMHRYTVERRRDHWIVRDKGPGRVAVAAVSQHNSKRAATRVCEFLNAGYKLADIPTSRAAQPK